MNNNRTDEILIGLTTVSQKDEASTLVELLLESNLIACGQIEGPIISAYKWNNKNEKTKEWRVSLKFPIEKKESLTQKIREVHPYETPQWIILTGQSTKEYCEWVNQ